VFTSYADARSATNPAAGDATCTAARSDAAATSNRASGAHPDPQTRAAASARERPAPSSLETLMALSDTGAREIANVLRKHVGQQALAMIVDDLLEIRGDKDFRDTIERLVHAVRTTN
jgi:hypothetical protein